MTNVTGIVGLVRGITGGSCGFALGIVGIVRGSRRFRNAAWLETRISLFLRRMSRLETCMGKTDERHGAVNGHFRCTVTHACVANSLYALSETYPPEHFDSH